MQVGLSEDNIFPVLFERFPDPGNSLEPDQFYGTRIIAEFCHQPFFVPWTGNLKGSDVSPDLDVRQLGTDLGNLVEP